MTRVDGELIDTSSHHNIKQALKHRQRAFESMKSILEDLDVEILSTADSDLTGDYGSMHLWERRSLEELASDLLDESDHPKLLVQKLLDEIEKYQGTLRRTKDFRRH